MINRVAVNKVVKILQSKTVASMSGKRVLRLEKSCSYPSERTLEGSIAVDIATCVPLCVAS